MTEQRKGKPRGRPVGTGTDDTLYLERIADLMAADPSLRVTRAIKRVLQQPDATSVVRRLQVKWKADGVRFLAEAQARHAEASRPRASAVRRSPHASSFEAYRRANDAHRALSEAFPAMSAMQELYNSPGMRLAREMYNSPQMQLAREMQNSPEMRLAREMQNHPAMQTARAILEAKASLTPNIDRAQFEIERSIRELIDPKTI